MDTLKTGFIVLLLLAVLYGVYVVLNKDQTPPNAEIAWHQQQAEQALQIDINTSNADMKSADQAVGIPSSEPKFLATPNKEPSMPTAETARMPSGVSAELSRPDGPTVNVDTVAADRGSKSSPLPAVPKGLNGTAQPALLPTGRADPSGIEVAAPSLLANRPSAESKAATQDNSSPAGRSNGLGSLPALRELPAAWPDSNTPVDGARGFESGAASPLPEKPGAEKAAPEPSGRETPAETVAASATNQAPPLAAAPALEAAPASPDLPTTTPGESTASATPEPILKAVSPGVAFDAALREVQSNIAAEQWYQALFVLSKFYGSPGLSAQQERELIDLLDPLAAKVVYSQEHLVTDAHEVRKGDTLAQIAASLQVPPELLSNINGIENPDLLVPGTKLKVVRGPFRADIHLQKKELTLFAGQLYAGRFPISLGTDPEPQPGEYRVLDKQPGHDFFSAAGQRMAASDPQNPYGKVWIGLDKELAIHGTPQQGDSGTMGCISLSPLDAADVYSMLTQGSSITIRR